MADQNQNPEGQQLNIELSEEVAGGVYANLAMINHSPTEFVVDYIQIMPGVPKAKVRSRVILTPQHAKRLLKAMAENINRYEKQFGEIQDMEMPPIPINFGGPAGQA
jgi:hypothetical protein